MRIPVIIFDKIYIPRAPELKGILDSLRNSCTHSNPDYFKAKQQGRWTGNLKPQDKTWSYVVYPEYGNCLGIPRGKSAELREIANENKIELTWIDHRVSIDPITEFTNDVELWPEQQKLAEIMFKAENCLIRSPTGSGKTELLLKVTEWMLKTAGPVLIIVWEGSRKSGLMKQWLDRITMRFGIRQSDIGIIGDGVKRIRPITVAMQQTLKNVGRRYIYEFGGIICDEIQRFAAPTFQRVVDIYPAKYRFGASADESRKDGKEYFIYDMFGNVAGEIEKATLITKGKVHDVGIRIINTKIDYVVTLNDEEYSWCDLPSEEKNFNELVNFLCNDEERNDYIWQFLEPCLKSGRTIIVGTHRVQHAIDWEKRITEAGYSSGLMLGGVNYQEEFEATANGLRTRKIQIGVGTIQKVSTGHDIPALDRGFILTPLAGNKQVLNQFTGRLSRPCEGKKDACIYYFLDGPIYPGHKRRLVNMYRGRCQLYVDGEFLSI